MDNMSMRVLTNEAIDLEREINSIYHEQCKEEIILKNGKVFKINDEKYAVIETDRYSVIYKKAEGWYQPMEVYIPPFVQ